MSRSTGSCSSARSRVIVGYGAWKTRGVKTADAYLRGGGDLKWYTIGLSIMATQASAITFLSMPGQAYEDGMGFVQFYFGLPIAMVILSAIDRAHLLPAQGLHRLRIPGDALRSEDAAADRAPVPGLSAGWRRASRSTRRRSFSRRCSAGRCSSPTWSSARVVILYTVSGGTRAVSRTQTWQMVVMLGGMALAFVFICVALPPALLARRRGRTSPARSAR